jgi:hypothetical protein
VAVTPRPLPTLSGQGPVPIIVDDDGSPDGMVALLYFLRNPLFEVKAVTISCGEAHLKYSLRTSSDSWRGLVDLTSRSGWGEPHRWKGVTLFPIRGGKPAMISGASPILRLPFRGKLYRLRNLSWKPSTTPTSR